MSKEETVNSLAQKVGDSHGILELEINLLIKNACKKQREICADNATAEMKLIKAPMGFSSKKPRVVRDSIINAPEPT